VIVPPRSRRPIYTSSLRPAPCLAGDVHQGIIEPRRQHSRKPDCVHERIERLVAGPFIELFARRTRRGWTCWGDEIPDPGIAPQPKKKQP
jgi:N6-adenosine-specific RNA methylase IME4